MDALPNSSDSAPPDDEAPNPPEPSDTGLQAPDSVAGHFQQFVQHHGGDGPVGEIATALACGELGTSSLRDVVHAQGGRRQLWFLKNMLDLVLDYVGTIAERGRISFDAAKDVEMLKVDFEIREGDFFVHRPVEVAVILSHQLDRILEDLQIDNAEDLYQVELQKAFDLGYDQYLQLTRPAFERMLLTSQLAVAEAEAQGDSEAVLRLQEKASALEPIVRLSLLQPRSIGALY